MPETAFQVKGIMYILNIEVDYYNSISYYILFVKH